MLSVLLAITAFAIAGRQNSAGRTADFRDAPNSGSALASLRGTAGGSGELPAPGTPLPVGGEAGDPKGDVSKQVKKFIDKNGADFDSYEASCKSLSACKLEDGYNLHEKIYRTKGDVSAVFTRFVTQNPRDAWNGLSKFELMYDKRTKREYTKASNDIPRIQVGQIFFLTLYLPLGLKMPVVFEIVKIDPERHEFAFSYVKTNKSTGIQFIGFSQNGDTVEIKHTTHFKSDSEFRDKYLYARFHESLTDDFYKNFFNSLSR